MLTERKETILKIIVGEYVSTAIPVASEAVVRRREVKVSPATVRHEMANLEEDGYILRPHASAGAMPSDKGYRYYVESQADSCSLPLELQTAIRRRFQQAEPNIETWTRLAATVLSHVIHNLAVVSFPRLPQTRLRQMGLVYFQEFLVLLVLVLQEAKLCQRLIPLTEPTTREEFLAVTNKLNHLFSGFNRHQIQGRQEELSPMEQEVMEGALQLLEAQDEETHLDYCMDGLRHVLSQPELVASEQARTLVEVLEDPTLVRTVLAITPEGRMRVIIGAENSERALHPFSVVLCPYGSPGEVGGTIGAIGPTRMEYPMTMGSVNYVSSLMSELLEGVYR